MTKIFGTTIRETIDAFQPLHLGIKGNERFSKRQIAIGRIIVSILLIIAGTIFIVGTKNTELGSAIFGAVMGYWLK
jgi:hypothetical protein